RIKRRSTAGAFLLNLAVAPCQPYRRKSRRNDYDAEPIAGCRHEAQRSSRSVDTNRRTTPPLGANQASDSPLDQRGGSQSGRGNARRSSAAAGTLCQLLL